MAVDGQTTEKYTVDNFQGSYMYVYISAKYGIGAGQNSWTDVI